MQAVVVLLIASVAFAAAHPSFFPKTEEYKACYEAMKGKVDKAEIREIVTSCIADQDGLQAIIDGLPTEGGPSVGEGIEKAKALKQFFHTPEFSAQALVLKQCIANRKGYLVDGKFNVEKIKADILVKVAGTAQEANTRLGLDNCSTAPLDTFDMMEYAKCVITYCATGSAPTE